MENMEELGQKGQNGSRKTMCRERGKKCHFQKGGEINIVFGLKYRPLVPVVQECMVLLIRCNNFSFTFSSL
jgi:hypothetical protein